MSLKSVSAFGLKVSDLNKSIKFYEDLGFNFRLKERDWARAYLNWFWIEFHEGKASAGDGVVQYVAVDDIENFHNEVVAKGFKPLSDPQLVPQGRLEFTLKDPDGYKLVFFTKK